MPLFASWDSFWSNLPNTLIGLAAVLTALGALRKVTQVQKELKANTQITETAAADVKTVKKLVNGKHDDLTQRVDTLQTTMEEHGIDWPPHPPEQP